MKSSFVFAVGGRNERAMLLLRTLIRTTRFVTRTQINIERKKWFLSWRIPHSVYAYMYHKRYLLCENAVERVAVLNN